MYGPSSILGKAFLFEIDNESYCADIKNDNSVARWIADFHGNLGGLKIGKILFATSYFTKLFLVLRVILFGVCHCVNIEY